MRCDHHFAKILLVLDPIELDLETGELILVDVALFQKRIEGPNDILRRPGGDLSLEVVEFEDHANPVPRGFSSIPRFERDRVRSGVRKVRPAPVASIFVRSQILACGGRLPVGDGTSKNKAGPS